MKRLRKLENVSILLRKKSCVFVKCEKKTFRLMIMLRIQQNSRFFPISFYLLDRKQSFQFVFHILGHHNAQFKGEAKRIFEIITKQNDSRPVIFFAFPSIFCACFTPNSVIMKSKEVLNFRALFHKPIVKLTSLLNFRLQVILVTRFGRFAATARPSGVGRGPVRGPRGQSRWL